MSGGCGIIISYYDNFDGEVLLVTEINFYMNYL